MIRTITRYRGGSRKLYDTTESRYISLEEIPAIIRGGDALKVVDSVTGSDVTGQVLAQVISAGERRGVSFVSADALHAIIRSGERLFVLLTQGLEQLEHSLTVVGGGARRRATSSRRRRVRFAEGEKRKSRTEKGAT